MSADRVIHFRIESDSAPSFDALSYKLDFLKKGIELKVNSTYSGKTLLAQDWQWVYARLQVWRRTQQASWRRRRGRSTRSTRTWSSALRTSRPSFTNRWWHSRKRSNLNLFIFLVCTIDTLMHWWFIFSNKGGRVWGICPGLGNCSQRVQKNKLRSNALYWSKSPTIIFKSFHLIILKTSTITSLSQLPKGKRRRVGGFLGVPVGDDCTVHRGNDQANKKKFWKPCKSVYFCSFIHLVRPWYDNHP